MTDEKNSGYVTMLKLLVSDHLGGECFPWYIYLGDAILHVWSTHSAVKS